MLSTGTVSGVAGFSEDAASLYLKPGDVIEAEIERIGVLRNPVISWQDGHGRRRAAARALVERTPVAAKRKAFITGITGQDGSYLAEILLEKGYEVYGMIRRSSSFNTARIDHIFGDVELVFGDLTDGSVLNQLMRTIRPDEVYNLGAQSHVRVSFDVPEYTADVDALGTLRLLDAIREEGVECRFYQASSSEMFGKVAEIPQRETTPFHPRSPYGVAKVFGYWITRNYREAYGMYAVQRHPLQPRVAAPRADVRHAQDHARGRRDPPRRAERAAARQPRRETRLGLRARLHGGRVADAPGATSRTTTCSPPARRTRSRSSSRRRSRTPGSTGTTT